MRWGGRGLGLHPLILLMAGIFCVGFFTSHGSLSFDPPARYLEAKSIVDHQDLRIRPLADEPLPQLIGRSSEWAIIDLKTGAIQPWVALQLAAYVELAREAGSKSCKRYAVRISKNGKYSVKEFPVRDLRNDLGIFRAAVSIYYWRNT